MNENRRPNDELNHTGDLEFFNVSLGGEQPDYNSDYADAIGAESHSDELPPEPSAGDSGNDTPPPTENVVPTPGEDDDGDDQPKPPLGPKPQPDLGEPLSDRESFFLGKRALTDLSDDYPERFDADREPEIINDPESLDPEEVRDRIKDIVNGREGGEAASEAAENDVAQEPAEPTVRFEPGDMIHFKDGELHEGADPEHSEADIDFYAHDIQSYGYAEADTFVAAKAPEVPIDKMVLNAHSEGCRIVAFQTDNEGAIVHIDPMSAFNNQGEELIDKALDTVPNLEQGKVVIFGDTDELGLSAADSSDWNDRLKAHLQEKGIAADVVTDGSGKDVYLKLSSENTQLWAKDTNGDLIYGTEPEDN